VDIIQRVKSALFPSILVLCGPPGSGKTMTLFSALRALPDMEVVGLNFSSATTPELLLKTFDHYCEYRKTPNGVVLSPVQVRLPELRPSVFFF
jgi:dynein heavy chain 1